MSAEFTPESERQRLQFLVRPNLSQLTHISPVDLPLPQRPLALLFHTLHVAMFFLSCWDTKPFSFFSALKAYMQPQLLGNEFTHLEFPRRVQRKEVGKRMLYRDFTMSGWWVKHIH